MEIVELKSQQRANSPLSYCVGERTITYTYSHLNICISYAHTFTIFQNGL